MEVDYDATATSLGYTGAAAPARRGANLKRLWEKVETRVHAARTGRNRTKTGDKSQLPLTCAMCGRSTETTWHIFGICKHRKMCQHRNTFFDKYDAALMRGTRGRGNAAHDAAEATHHLEINARPSTELLQIFYLRGGEWTPRPRWQSSLGTIQALFRGLVPVWLPEILSRCGATDETMNEALKRHGEFMTQ